MATMDIIKHYGGDPANFLDVGGGARQRKLPKLSKSFCPMRKLKGFLLTFSAASCVVTLSLTVLLQLLSKLGLTVRSLFVWKAQMLSLAKKFLTNPDLNIVAADSMADGAQKIVALVK